MVNRGFTPSWLQVGLTPREVVQQGLVATLRCLADDSWEKWGLKRKKDIKHATDVDKQIILNT